MLRLFKSLTNNTENIKMTIRRKVISTLPVLFLSGLLTACGGGSEASVEKPTTPTTPTSTIDDEFGYWLTDLANNHVLPSYQSLQDSSALLNSQAIAFCANTSPSDSDLTNLQGYWRESVTSWQKIQWLKVGPIVSDNRIFRLHYWPDSKDNVGRGISNLLTTSEVIDESFIAKQSVGSQGFPALEQILFTTTQDGLLNALDKEKRCEILIAISANIATISASVNSEWQIDAGNYHEQLTQGTGDFTSKKDAVEELVTNLLEQIERVKDEKMLVPLASASPGLPDIAEHVLSDDSIRSIQTNITSFKEIFTAGSGHGFDDILIDHLAQQNIATEMTTAIENAIECANELDGSYPALLKSAEGRIKITKAIDSLRAIRDVLTVDFVQATDINIGFNSNDGD